MIMGKLFLWKLCSWHNNWLVFGVFKINFHDKNAILCLIEHALWHDATRWIFTVSDAQVFQTVVAWPRANQLSVCVLLIANVGLASLVKCVSHREWQTRCVNVDKVASFLRPLRKGRFVTILTCTILLTVELKWSKLSPASNFVTYIRCMPFLLCLHIFGWSMLSFRELILTSNSVFARFYLLEGWLVNKVIIVCKACLTDRLFVAHNVVAIICCHFRQALSIAKVSIVRFVHFCNGYRGDSCLSCIIVSSYSVLVLSWMQAFSLLGWKVTRLRELFFQFQIMVICNPIVAWSYLHIEISTGCILCW